MDAFVSTLKQLREDPDFTREVPTPLLRDMNFTAGSMWGRCGKSFMRRQRQRENVPSLPAGEEETYGDKKNSSSHEPVHHRGTDRNGIFIFYGVQNRIFVSRDALELFLHNCGVWAPALFVLIQIVQVVIPILPGAIGCLGGVLIFGCVGICI